MGTAAAPDSRAAAAIVQGPVHDPSREREATVIPPTATPTCRHSRSLVPFSRCSPLPFPMQRNGLGSLLFSTDGIVIRKARRLRVDA